MKKILFFAIALLSLASCGLKEEFQPVFTGKYPDSKPMRYYTDDDFDKIISIKELASKYTIGTPVTIAEDVVIKGVVTTTDKPGNFYKSFYIQDQTGGIELKIGKNGLYNDYLLGQTVYVSCSDLTIGMYGNKSGKGVGMISLGYSDPSGNYETSYLEIPMLIESHIFRGDPALLTEIEPIVVTSESQLPKSSDTQATNSMIGKYVTFKGLKYGNKIFALLYLDSNREKKDASNRIFLSDSQCGVTTWAMSKNKMAEYLYSGIWDNFEIGSGSTRFPDPDYPDDSSKHLTVGHYRGDGKYDKLVNDYNGIEKSAQSISQYFKLGGADIQIRTSGYCKFADVEIDPAVLDGVATIDVTGILTLYQGGYQVYVNSLDDVVIND